MKTIKVKIEIPKELNVSKKTKEDIETNLAIKRLKGYGFFDKNGIWKEK